MNQNQHNRLMSAKLNSHIQYENGYITVIDSLDEEIIAKDFELVEDGCRGWGESNAVVKAGESYYLATVFAKEMGAIDDKT